MDRPVSAADLTDAVVQTVRTLDNAVARWTGDRNREAVPVAISAAEEAVAQLHRVRDALVREAREHDAATRPYNEGRDL
jgi:hypothetical protein